MPRLNIRSCLTDRAFPSRPELFLVLLGKLGRWAAKRHLAQAKNLRDRAEKCRALAEVATDDRVAASYVLRADKYDRQARQEADLAYQYET